MSIGKYIRMYRILNPKTNRTIIVPMDHGGFGILEGVENIKESVRRVVNGGANAVVLQPGAAKATYKELVGKAGLILRISRVTIFNAELGLYEAITYDVKDAIRLGADAVIVTFYMGGKYEFESMKDVGRICAEADRWGIPCLVEAIPSQDKFKGFDDPAGIIYAIRSASELGADMIKAYLPTNIEIMKEAVKKSPAPICLAGGEATSGRAVLELAKMSMDAGIAGLCFGRKIFQYKDPTAMVRALSLIVHENADVEEAFKLLPE